MVYGATECSPKYDSGSDRRAGEGMRKRFIFSLRQGLVRRGGVEVMERGESMQAKHARMDGQGVNSYSFVIPPLSWHCISIHVHVHVCCVTSDVIWTDRQGRQGKQ